MEENMSASSSTMDTSGPIDLESVNNANDEEQIDWMSLDFATAADAYSFYCDYAHGKGFSVRKMYEKKLKNEPDRVQYLEYACNKEGFRAGSNLKPNDNRFLQNPSKYLKARNSDETRTGCGAKIRFHFKKDEEAYRVTYFCGDHNHELHPPSAKHMLKSYRKVDDPHKLIAEIYKDAGLPLRSLYDLMKSGGGGEGYMGFSKNVSQRRRQKSLKLGEAAAVLQYFSKQSLNNPFLFYKFDLDSDEKIMNIFWSDAQMRMDYSMFGDCVTFDVTYRTNKNYKPLVVFVGFNHHRQSCIFGAALLLDETLESFEWLFNTFVTCMQGKAPKTIFTDQDSIIGLAIRKSLPNTYHALCSWHVLENAKKNLSKLYTDRFASMFHQLLYSVRDEHDFDREWQNMVSSCFPTGEHKWITDIHGLRKQWSSAWLRCQFTSGMGTLLSESFNSIVKRHLRPVDNLIQFLTDFERVVHTRRVEEKQQDFNARDRTLTAKHVFNPLMKSAAKVYTPSIFALLNKEYESSFAYIFKPMDGLDVGLNMVNKRRYLVYKSEDVHPSVLGHEVDVNVDDASITCSCHLFDHTGILCSHALRIMDVLGAMGASNFRTIPEKYILKRWSRNAKEGMNITHVHPEQPSQLEGSMERYQSLCGMFLSSAMMLCRDKDMCASFITQFQKLLNSVLQDASASSTKLTDTHEVVDDNNKS